MNSLIEKHAVKRILLKSLVFTIALLSNTSAGSSDLDTVLAKKQAPPGIVFEIVSDDPGLLGELLPSVKTDIKKLRDRFPGLPIAIVTHGLEQFDPSSKNSSKEKKTHDLVQELVTANEVDVHVCGTHASWYGVMPEDFPDYVDVSPAGPAQINDYEALGYEIIILTE